VTAADSRSASGRADADAGPAMVEALNIQPVFLSVWAQRGAGPWP
jgi:hypothetical protein